MLAIAVDHKTATSVPSPPRPLTPIPVKKRQNPLPTSNIVELSTSNIVEWKTIDHDKKQYLTMAMFVKSNISHIWKNKPTEMLQYLQIKYKQATLGHQIMPVMDWMTRLDKENQQIMMKYYLVSVTDLVVLNSSYQFYAALQSNLPMMMLSVFGAEDEPEQRQVWKQTCHECVILFYHTLDSKQQQLLVDWVNSYWKSMK